MDGVLILCASLDFVLHEVALFAAIGFLVLGTSDVVVDSIWIARTLSCRLRGQSRGVPELLLSSQSCPPGRFAVFIPAWDESGVIGEMLGYSLATLAGAEYRIYVGCYPNDPDTIAVIRNLRNARIRLVIGTAPGPTTKAGCLNSLWRAMLADEQAEGRPFKAIVLHDAEDVVHHDELAIFDRLIGRFDLVQLPVLPLIDPNSRWIAGHYADEFAEAHGKDLVVRAALGVGLPSAGVGCAFSRGALAEIADSKGGDPFDADSLTEDYELGLRLHARGRRGIFVRMPGKQGLVTTREYFPGMIRSAVGQKARWMTGIALSGWDRLGWSGGLAERWMRLRDRQSVLAAIILFAGYVGLILWGLLGLADVLLGVASKPAGALLSLLLGLNAMLLAWRLAMRFVFVTRAYGWREGVRSIPRVVTGNAIAMLAARRAVGVYLKGRRSGETHWDKTSHAFPTLLSTK